MSKIDEYIDSALKALGSPTSAGKERAHIYALFALIESQRETTAAIREHLKLYNLYRVDDGK